MKTSHVINDILFPASFTLMLGICSCSTKEKQAALLPEVRTDSAISITSTSSRIKGSVLSPGETGIVEVGFFLSITPSPGVSDSVISMPFSSQPFGADLTGLVPATMYYYRAFATSQTGTGYGEECSFMTLDSVPTVTTAPVNNILYISAVSGGYVNSEGGAPVVARGVCWSTSPEPTLADDHTTDGSGPGGFISEITGLSENTHYFLRAYATSALGTGYDGEISFTTLNPETGGIPCPGLPVFLDPRDGQSYQTVQIGSQCWLKSNLNFDTAGSWCADNDPLNCSIYGRLYNWETALHVCPPGWHLPDSTEWGTLAFTLGGYPVAGMKMKSTGGWYNNQNGTNESGFTGLPGGTCSPTGISSCLGVNAVFTSSTFTSPFISVCSLGGWNSLEKGLSNTWEGLSARCIRD